MRLYWNQAKEGGGEMSPSERQAAIWDIVYQQRYETVPKPWLSGHQRRYLPSPAGLADH